MGSQLKELKENFERELHSLSKILKQKYRLIENVGDFFASNKSSKNCFVASFKKSH